MNNFSIIKLTEFDGHRTQTIGYIRAKNVDAIRLEGAIERLLESERYGENWCLYEIVDDLPRVWEAEELVDEDMKPGWHVDSVLDV